MYAVLAEESLTRLCSNTELKIDAKDPPCLHHNRISNLAILNNACIYIYAIRFMKMASLMKP